MNGAKTVPRPGGAAATTRRHFRPRTGLEGPPPPHAAPDDGNTNDETEFQNLHSWSGRSTAPRPAPWRRQRGVNAAAVGRNQYT